MTQVLTLTMQSGLLQQEQIEMLKKLLMNLLLTFVWVALTGRLLFVNFAFGFILAFIIMWVTERRGDRGYFNRIPKIISFTLFFIFELVKANLEVAFHVVSPRLRMKPGIVAIPLNVTTDFEITLLANLITLTPGTLSLDVSDDKKVLYVHSLNIKDRDQFIASIKDGFEKRILEITR